MVGEEPADEAPVDEAPKGLYIKFRKTRTFEMDVKNYVHISRLSNLAHNIDVRLYQYH